MAPCGPVVALAGDLWEVWESARAYEGVLESLETRYKALNLAFIGLEERQVRLEPFESLLFTTGAPLTEDVDLRLERRPAQP